MTMQRAILINPIIRTTCEVYIEPTIDGMYYALGKTDAMFSGMVECVNLGQRENRGVDCWIDEEGALSEGRAVFVIGNEDANMQPLAGCALIIDNDGEGNTVGTKLTVETVGQLVTWTNLETTGDFGPGREYETEHPIFGKIPVIEGGKPLYRERA